MYLSPFKDLTLPALPCNSKADSSNEDLAKEKEKLQNDILLLRAEYELEVRKANTVIKKIVSKSRFFTVHLEYKLFRLRIPADVL